MDIAHEKKKIEKEPESLSAKEMVKTVAKKSTDSSALFNKIYEKYMGEKVNLNVCLFPLC